jgi:hypothetical protein
MLRIVIVLLAVLLLSSLFYRDMIRSQPTPNEGKVTSPLPSATPIPSATPTSPIPPFYPGIKWKKPVRIRQGMYSSKGLIELDVYLVDTEVLKTYPKTFPDDFIKYYEREFAARNWELVAEVGPGPGGPAVYRFYENNGYHAVLCVSSLEPNGHPFSAYLAYN